MNVTTYSTCVTVALNHHSTLRGLILYFCAFYSAQVNITCRITLCLTMVLTCRRYTTRRVIRNMVRVHTRVGANTSWLVCAVSHTGKAPSPLYFYFSERNGTLTVRNTRSEDLLHAAKTERPWAEDLGNGADRLARLSLSQSQ